MMKTMFLAAAAVTLLAAPADAQRAPGSAEAAQALPGASATAQQGNSGSRGQTIASVDDVRVNQLIVYGNDPCPKTRSSSAPAARRMTVSGSPHRFATGRGLPRTAGRTGPASFNMSGGRGSAAAPPPGRAARPAA